MAVFYKGSWYKSLAEVCDGCVLYHACVIDDPCFGMKLFKKLLEESE